MHRRAVRSSSRSDEAGSPARAGSSAHPLGVRSAVPCRETLWAGGSVSKETSTQRPPAGSAQLAVGASAGSGDVRARRRHLADERLDLGRGQGSRHDGERRPVRDRARGPGLGRLHPDQQQGRRPHRSQACLRAGPARLRDRRLGDDPGPEPDGDHHLLGDPGGPGCLVAAARHAVPHPRELRRRGAEEDLRPGRCRCRDRRRRRATAGRFRHHVPVVARRVPPRGRGHRGGAQQHQDGPGRRLHGTSARRRGRCGPLRRGHGRRRPRHPGLAGRRGSRRRAHRDRC